jgi:hypothetical protein
MVTTQVDRLKAEADKTAAFSFSLLPKHLKDPLVMFFKELN